MNFPTSFGEQPSQNRGNSRRGESATMIQDPSRTLIADQAFIDPSTVEERIVFYVSYKTTVGQLRSDISGKTGCPSNKR